MVQEITQAETKENHETCERLFHLLQLLSWSRQGIITSTLACFQIPTHIFLFKFLDEWMQAK